jgi:hypothetical protein
MYTKMADVPVPGCWKYWTQRLVLLKSEFHAITNKYHKTTSVTQQVYRKLSDIQILAGCTPAKVGESYEWASIVNCAENKMREMADYSAIKSYLEKNNLHYFIFSQNSKEPIKAVIHHLSPDTSAEDISNSLEDLGFNIINMEQMVATRAASNG